MDNVLFSRGREANRFWKASCLFVLVFSGFSGLAAQDVFDHPLSAETMPRYAALCAELSARPLVKGSFEQTRTIVRLGRSLVSQGNFIIAADLGMVWDTLSPFPSTMAVGRDYIIQSSPGGNKSKIDGRGNEIFANLADTLSSIFTGNSQTLTAKFENFFREDKDAGLWTLGLIPRENAVSVFAQRIVLSGENNPARISSIAIYAPGGDSTSYVLKNHHFPAALEADEKALFSM